MSETPCQRVQLRKYCDDMHEKWRSVITAFLIQFDEWIMFTRKKNVALTMYNIFQWRQWSILLLTIKTGIWDRECLLDKWQYVTITMSTSCGHHAPIARTSLQVFYLSNCMRARSKNFIHATFQTIDLKTLSADLPCTLRIMNYILLFIFCIIITSSKSITLNIVFFTQVKIVLC